MRRFLQRTTDFIYRVTANGRFFAPTLLLFVAQATWLVFTASYPLPFDEFAHVGAIQLYAEQWSWIVTSQPINTGTIGDLTREPSFLYRWLMSFPYRALDSFLSLDQTIIVMRLMNVAMVVGGIILFRKLLHEWGISKRITNIVLLAFVMTPMVPFLAAHVNYDNMMFLLTPVVLLYAGRLIKGNKNIITNVAMFVLSGLTAVLAKQTFLPIMAIVSLYALIVVLRRNYGNTIAVLRDSWQKTPKNIYFYLVVVSILILGLMGAGRYGTNIVRYGAIQPNCEKVQPVELCEKFGPWYRNNVINVQNKPDEPPYGNPLSFSQYWVSRMVRGYFAIFQHTPTAGASSREPYGPIVVMPLLPMSVGFAIVVIIIGGIAIILQRRRLWRDDYMRFAMVLSFGFIIVQWTYNYSGYLRMWKAEAIQARYTYPIMILVFTLIAWALNKSIASRHIKVGMVVALLIFYVWGGGVTGWLIRADDTWRWQNPVVQTINHKVQTVLRFTVIH